MTTLGLRRATRTDADLLLSWANDPVTRAAGFHPAPIDRATHLAWLDRRLDAPGSRLWIGVHEGQPVGLLRLERDEAWDVEVGIAIAPEWRGRGLATALLRAGLVAASGDVALAPRRYIARVRPGNAASLELFRGAGFVERSRVSIDGEACIVLARSADATEP